MILPIKGMPVYDVLCITIKCSELCIIQSYEPPMVPRGTDKRGSTVRTYMYTYIHTYIHTYTAGAILKEASIVTAYQ